MGGAVGKWERDLGASYIVKFYKTNTERSGAAAAVPKCLRLSTVTPVAGSSRILGKTVSALAAAAVGSRRSMTYKRSGNCGGRELRLRGED